jgi:5-methylcytosine-specific restriction endonuclease McrA
MKDPLERERYNARQRERYPTYRAERLAEYRRNPEKNKAAVRAWQERNREKCILYACNHSARRRVAKESGMSGPDYRAWVLRQKKVCHWCGAKCAKQFEVDHIQPLARGGKHEPRNLAISCRTCNRSKSARDPIEWAQMLGKLL